MQVHGCMLFRSCLLELVHVLIECGGLKIIGIRVVAFYFIVLFLRVDDHDVGDDGDCVDDAHAGDG